jgi:hypothetical protein
MLGIEQSERAEMAGPSFPAIQHIESSSGQVRGTIDTLTKGVEALEGSGVGLIGDNRPTTGLGRGVRLRDSDRQPGLRKRAADMPEKIVEHAA